MCGIIGSAAAANTTLSCSEAQARSMLAALAYRGPDDEGLVPFPRVQLGHRRLAVRDLGPAAHQPMRSEDGRWTLVYNGELYDEPELRAELEAKGRRFVSSGDTEVLLAAFEAYGSAALTRVRGMYALAAYDHSRERLVLARDPLGIKPLYWWCDGRELVFASSPPALFAHPRVSPQPNWPMVSAYLTTIRTVIGRHTLFEGVHALEPGEVLEVDLSAERLEPRRCFPHPHTPVAPSLVEAEAVERVRAVVGDSISRHLTADVPSAVFLSGGLDSTIVATRVLQERTPVPTWAAGAAAHAGSDLAEARAVAAAYGTQHGEVTVDRADFLATWTRMIDALGVPLSTPNEVAIHGLARALRSAGQVVALCGEGADELFGGYADTLTAAEQFEASRPPGLSPARFQLESAAWVSPGDKPEVLRDGLAEALGHDEFLIHETEVEFERGRLEAGPGATPLDAHLRFQRSRNLTGLLQRLDTATMLAGVEGRTPFADVEVQRVADAIPMQLKLDRVPAPVSGGGATGAPPVRLGKRVLRTAFAGELTPEVLTRPKASFPLPFHRWIKGERERLRTSGFARTMFRHEVLDLVAADLERNWAFAWPMTNLARWGDRWWG